jgi:hypothetical protein
LLVKASSIAEHPQRHELAVRAIRLANETAELDVVLNALSSLNQASRANIHDEVELAELSAQGILSGEKQSAQARLHRCVLSTDANRSHRINAARALLVIADQAGGSGLLSNDLEALRDVIQLHAEAEDPDALRLLILFHATVGDVDKLAGLSDRLRELAHHASPAMAANLYHYAGSGFWRAGRITDSLSSCRQAFEAADSVGLRRAQFLAASMLSSFNHDIGNESESRTWMEIVERLADELPGLRSSMAYVSICFEIALARADTKELKRLLDVVSQVGLVAGRDRMARGLEISIKRLSAEPFDRHSVVRELTKYHVAGGESGNVSDLEVAIAADLLDAECDQEGARVIIRDYLRVYRRAAAPIAAMLRDSIRRLQIDELPLWCRIYGSGPCTDDSPSS